jgi:hypothetical protein
LPRCISVLIFSEMTFCELPFLSGIEVYYIPYILIKRGYYQPYMKKLKNNISTSPISVLIFY